VRREEAEQTLTVDSIERAAALTADSSVKHEETEQARWHSGTHNGAALTVNSIEAQRNGADTGRNGASTGGGQHSEARKNWQTLIVDSTETQRNVADTDCEQQRGAKERRRHLTVDSTETRRNGAGTDGGQHSEARRNGAALTADNTNAKMEQIVYSEGFFMHHQLFAVLMRFVLISIFLIQSFFFSCVTVSTLKF